jgi:hypothetical protein
MPHGARRRRTVPGGVVDLRSRQSFERAAERTSLHAGIAATAGPWIGRRVAGSYNWIYGARTDGTRAMPYLDRGAVRRGENDAIYQALLAHRAEIEESFGGPLGWEEPLPQTHRVGVVTPALCSAGQKAKAQACRRQSETPLIKTASQGAIVHRLTAGSASN